MFDVVYYLGVLCIEFIQDSFAGSEGLIAWINNLADPHHAYVYIFPLVALLDSAFAAQYLLVMAGGEWLNVVLKWILAEHRPYWWVQETDYYSDGARPTLLQTSQTCETGPGCPSGHVMNAASHVVLVAMWASHIAADRKSRVPAWLSWLAVPLASTLVSQVGVARLAIATHFPHQVLLGALSGLLLTPILTIFVSDPYLWLRRSDTGRRQLWHVGAALGAAAVGVAVYWCMKLVGVDPQWSVKLAFKWCKDPHSIHVSTTPLFALVESCALLLAEALCVTPLVTRYRYNTKSRSLLISLTCGVAFHHLSSIWQQKIPTENVLHFYAHQFVYYMVQVVVYLRGIPLLSMLPWSITGSKKVN